ncbi:hypothetical protein PO909_033289 [Leuciscus waleckii]
MLADLDLGRTEKCVRLNSVSSGLAEADMEVILQADVLPTALMLPKVENTGEVQWEVLRILQDVCSSIKAGLPLVVGPRRPPTILPQIRSCVHSLAATLLSPERNQLESRPSPSAPNSPPSTTTTTRELIETYPLAAFFALAAPSPQNPCLVSIRIMVDGAAVALVVEKCGFSQAAYSDRKSLSPESGISVCTSAFVDRFQQYLKGRELEEPIRLVTFVETALGLLNFKAVCEALRDLGPKAGLHHDGVVFGSDDFCASIGATRTKDAKELLYARQKVVVTTKAFGLQAIDLVYIDYKDVEGLRQQAREGTLMGFTGKQVIHPNQIKAVQEEFSPSPERIKWATELISAFEEHQNLGKGAFTFHGSMIDMPSLKQAQNIVTMASTVQGKGLSKSFCSSRQGLNVSAAWRKLYAACHTLARKHVHKELRKGSLYVNISSFLWICYPISCSHLSIQLRSHHEHGHDVPPLSVSPVFLTLTLTRMPLLK